MLPDTETLKSLLSDLQTSGAGSRLRVATRTIESMRVELLAEVIRLREQLATVEGERDKALTALSLAQVERKKACEQAAELRASLTELADAARAYQKVAREVADDWKETRAEVERLREQLNSTVPADNEEPAQITASWRIAGTEAQLHADDNFDMIGAYWQRAGEGWSAGTLQGVTVHDSREDAESAVEKWAKNCGFLVRK